jgi:hypothetical protein
MPADFCFPPLLNVVGKIGDGPLRVKTGRTRDGGFPLTPEDR